MIQTSTSLKKEPSSELLLITAKQLFLNRDRNMSIQSFFGSYRLSHVILVFSHVLLSTHMVESIIFLIFLISLISLSSFSSSCYILFIDTTLSSKVNPHHVNDSGAKFGNVTVEIWTQRTHATVEIWTQRN